MVTLPYHKGRMQDGSWQSWRGNHSIGIDIALVDDLGAAVRSLNWNRRPPPTTAAEHERAAQEHERFNSEQRERFNEERQRFNSEQRERFNSEQRERFNKERQLLEAEFTQTLSGERARAAEESRLRLSESLNQTLRRIRHTAAEHEALQLLLEDSPADRAVVLLIENNQARVAAWRNVQLREEDEDRPVDLRRCRCPGILRQ